MGQDQSLRKSQSGGHNTSSQATDLRVVLRLLRRHQTKPKMVLNVERSDILRSAISYLKRPDIEYSPLEIRMELEGVPEDTIDLGGPNREFFTLLFKEFLKAKVDMFEGQSQGRCLLPVNNDNALSERRFELVGKAIVISLCSGGPGFPYLAPCVVSYIRGESYLHLLNIALVYNTSLRQFIKKINNVKSEDQLADVLYKDDTERFTDNCGWPRNEMITLENRLRFTQTLLKWELIGKRVASLEQLKEGLNTLGFLDRTRGNPEVAQFLTHLDAEKVTADYLRKSLKREINKLTPTNQRESEAKEYTTSCVEMMTDKEATNLFHFITGMTDLPVEDIPLEVEFNTTNSKAELPEAITCIQRLRIPLGNDSRMSFYSSIHKALTLGKYGFAGNDDI